MFLSVYPASVRPSTPPKSIQPLFSASQAVKKIDFEKDLRPLTISQDIEGTLKKLKEYLDTGVDFFSRHGSTTFLNLYVYNPHPAEHVKQMIQFYKKNSLDIYTPDENGMTPFHMAVFIATPSTMEVLLKEDVSPNHKTKYGETVLDLAMKKNRHEQKEIVALLEKAGAKKGNDPSLPPSRFTTLLITPR